MSNHDPELFEVVIERLERQVAELGAERDRLREALAATGGRLGQATAILQDLLSDWDHWQIERVRRGPFSPPINATRAWLKGLDTGGTGR